MAMIAGACATGCGPSVILTGDDEGSSASDGGGSTGPGATSTSGSMPTIATSTSAEAEAEGGVTSDAPRFDVAVDPSVDPPPAECPIQPEPPVEACTAELPEGWDAYFQFYCVDLSEAGSCETWAQEFSESDNEWMSACVRAEDCFRTRFLEVACGPLPDSGDQCCYWFSAVDEFLCPGRPFVVAGHDRLAALTRRGDWSVETPLSAASPSSHRAQIAAVWAEQALFEHASIASFSRFVLQLLGCGAPAHLVAAAGVALGEEIEHARLFFGFSSRYAGRAIGPDLLDTQDAMAESADFDGVVLSAVREGCIAETISAWHVNVAARSARDPQMARVLARVAEQELEHAALAWRFLAWALPRASDALVLRVREALKSPERCAPRGPVLPTALPAETWLAHGILPPAVHAASTAQALRELVAPLARSFEATIPPAVGRDRWALR